MQASHSLRLRAEIVTRNASAAAVRSGSEFSVCCTRPPNVSRVQLRGASVSEGLVSCNAELGSGRTSRRKEIGTVLVDEVLARWPRDVRHVLGFEENQGALPQ